MNKSNVTKNKWNPAIRRNSLPYETKFQCPICKKIVSEADFISSYRLIEGLSEPAYEIKNLCRACRDSGE